MFPLSQSVALKSNPPEEKTTDPLPSSALSINPGDRVLAGWKDKNCFYLGEVIESKDNKYYIHYDFSADAWVGADHVFLYKPPAVSKLKPGAKVFVGLESGSKWASERVKENRNGLFLVRLDNKDQCRSQKKQHWASIEMLILRK